MPKTPPRAPVPGRSPSSPGESPSGIAFDPGGNLHVVDSLHDRIRVFDPAGAVLGARRIVAFTYGPHVVSSRVMEKADMRLVRTYKPLPEELLELLGVTDPSVVLGNDVGYAITQQVWE